MIHTKWRKYFNIWRNMGDFYRVYFKRKYFNRTLLVYSTVTVVALSAIGFFSVQKISGKLRIREIALNRQMVERVLDTFVDKADEAEEIFQEIHRNSYYSREVRYMARYGYHRHLEYRLENFYQDPTLTPRSIDIYFASLIEKGTIDSMFFASLITGEAYFYYLGGKKLLDNQRRLIQVTPHLLGGGYRRTLPAQVVALEGEEPKRLFSFQFNMKDAFGVTELARIIINFRTDNIDSFLQNYEKDFIGRILIVNREGDTVYDSDGEFSEEQVSYMEQVLSLRTWSAQDGRLLFQAEGPVLDGIYAVGLVPEIELADQVRPLIRTILLVSILCIFLALSVVFIVTNRTARRFSAITDAMIRLKEGDTSVRIPVRSEDEIGAIERDFNNMCEDLSRYIEQTYVLKMKQKSAEAEALQAKINPHFLYNTLEAIRMRAVTEGSATAAEMIFMLSTFFRNIVRHRESVTDIGTDIRSCRLYLDIFKICYGRKLHTLFYVEESIEGYGIPALLIQPLVENYTIHGFDYRRADNRIRVTGRKRGNTITLVVADNGKGIQGDRLREIKALLKDPNGRNDRGLLNVNERIHLMFGEGYGIKLSGGEEDGTIATMTIPAMKKSEMVRYVQSTVG